MPAKGPKNITPKLQWAIMCQAVVTDVDGGFSFQQVFDTVTATQPFPIPLTFTLSVQFRDGVGHYKYWLRAIDPEDVVTDFPDQSFWLESSIRAHRLDARVQMGVRMAGKYWFAVMLDGREVIRVPLIVNTVAQAADVK